jgi:AcrR family transcriptional regulator
MNSSPDHEKAQTPPAPGRRSGRRPGTSGTRDAIAAAAREAFAGLGYDRASLRGIAQRAGVDPALVLHFFGSKQQLFASVVQLPFDPETVLPQVLAVGRGAIGESLARFVVGMLETERGRNSLTGIVRAAASEPAAARIVREMVTERIFVPLAEALGTDDAQLRASLVGSQVVGLVMARYVVAVEPLASADPATVIAAIGPTLQRYLVEPLPAVGRPS